MAKSAKKKTKKRKTKNVRKSFSPLVILALLSIICLITFSPAINADFVYWDDDINVYENPNIQSLSAEHIKAIFTEDIIGNYNPLPIFTFAVEHAIFGMNPKVMHITNILLHILGCLLVYLIAFRLKLDRWGALLVAVLFAIHPMRVESVAWITERKDVLFGLFYWLSLLWYIRSINKGQQKYFWLALLVFPLALLSKIQAVSLPLSMLCIDYFVNGKIKWKDILQKWPFFLLSLITGLYGVFALSEQGSLSADQTADIFNFTDRIFIGAFSYMVYLYKLIIPYPMAPMYPYPDGLGWIHYTTAALSIPLLFGLYWLWKHQYKALLFGIAFFTVNVIFVLQVVGAGQGYLADRFTYIGYFGFFFIGGFYFSKYQLHQSSWKWLVAAVLLAYGVIVFQQSKIWKNSDTMWSHVLEVNDKTPLPYGNRGNYYRDNGMIDKALADYTAAVRLDPKRHATFNSRGRLYFQTDQLQKALSDYNAAIELNPNNGEYFSNRGATYARLGKLEIGLQDLNRSIELKPDHAEAYLNRALILDAFGNSAAAADDVEQYLKMRPKDAEIWFNYALFALKSNQVKRATSAIDQAIVLQPSTGKFYVLRAKIHLRAGNKAAAQSDAQKAAQLGTPLEPEWLQRINQ